jgi:hypothetical protein
MMITKAVFRWLTLYLSNSPRSRRKNLTAKFRSAAVEGHLSYVDMRNKITEDKITMLPDPATRPSCHFWDGTTQRLQAQRMIKSKVKETPTCRRSSRVRE